MPATSSDMTGRLRRRFPLPAEVRAQLCREVWQLLLSPLPVSSTGVAEPAAAIAEDGRDR